MGIRTRHTISGVIDPNTPEHVLEHPVFGQYLEVVGEDAKPFLPELHKPRTAEADEPESAEPNKPAPANKNKSKD